MATYNSSYTDSSNMASSSAVRPKRSGVATYSANHPETVVLNPQATSERIVEDTVEDTKEDTLKEQNSLAKHHNVIIAGKCN